MDAPIAKVRITRGLTGETVCEVQVPIGITVWKLRLEIEKTVRTPASLQQLRCNMQMLSSENTLSTLICDETTQQDARTDSEQEPRAQLTSMGVFRIG